MKCYTKGYLQFWIYAQIIKSIDGNFMIPDIESHPKNNFFRKKTRPYCQRQQLYGLGKKF